MLADFDDPVVADESAVHHSLDSTEIDIEQITLAEACTGIDLCQKLRILDGGIERGDAIVDAPLVAITEQDEAHSNPEKTRGSRRKVVEKLK